MRSDPPVPPPDPRPRSLDEQLRALGHQLDRAAPSVGPDELRHATPGAELGHLQALDPAGPDSTAVIPLAPLRPALVPARRRPRWLLGVAAAVAIVLAAAGLGALTAGDDVVGTGGQLAELPPGSDPPGPPAVVEPDADPGEGTDLPPTFEELDAALDRFTHCMDEADLGDGSSDEDLEGLERVEALAELLTDPATYQAVRDCLASSGIDDVDLGSLLAEVDDLPVFEDIDDIEDVDAGEIAEAVDEWLGDAGDWLAGLDDDVDGADDEVDRVLTCMEARGWSAATLGEPDAPAQLLEDLQACADEG